MIRKRAKDLAQACIVFSIQVLPLHLRLNIWYF